MGERSEFMTGTSLIRTWIESINLRGNSDKQHLHLPHYHHSRPLSASVEMRSDCSVRMWLHWSTALYNCVNVFRAFLQNRALLSLIPI